MGYYNSTIRPKKKICRICQFPKFIFSDGRCVDCARIEDAQARMQEDTTEEDGLPELTEDADAIFSKYMRRKYADENGLVQCFTCSNKLPVAKMQNGHYMKRGNMFLRLDERNCRPQCKTCNEYKDGMFLEFGKRLELERPGITEILLAESRIVYKFSRDEVRGIIAEYSQRLSVLKNAG